MSRRIRQQENVEKLSTCSTFLVHFFAVTARLRREIAFFPIFFFRVRKLETTNFSLSVDFS